MSVRRSLSERFWAKVEVRGGDDCWPWIGVVKKSGYAQIKVGRQMKSAHRVAWEITNGPIPEGMVLDHICHGGNCPGGRVCPHRSCCNPGHLRPTSSSDNTLRSPQTLPARHAARTHCPQGHPYDDLNTRLYQGRRYCRECLRQRNASGVYRKKARQ